MHTPGASANARRAGVSSAMQALSRLGGSLSENLAWARESRRARRLYHDLGMRPGHRFQDLVDAVAHRRGRDILFLELELPPHVSGFCVLADSDFIVTNARDSESQRRHTGAHELRHLLAGGPSHAAGAEVTAGSFLDLPSLPPGVAEEVLTRPAQLRSCYGDEEEFTAEVFATVVLPLLDPDNSSAATNSMTSSFSNRRSEI
ncbi:hypothetical protein ACWCP6_28530 [Streptomyces sp. NPDC002004]